jgi:hypothetical protein
MSTTTAFETSLPLPIVGVKAAPGGTAISSRATWRRITTSTSGATGSSRGPSPPARR